MRSTSNPLSDCSCVIASLLSYWVVNENIHSTRGKGVPRYVKSVERLEIYVRYSWDELRAHNNILNTDWEKLGAYHFIQIMSIYVNNLIYVVIVNWSFNYCEIIVNMVLAFTQQRIWFEIEISAGSLVSLKLRQYILDLLDYVLYFGSKLPN